MNTSEPDVTRVAVVAAYPALRAGLRAMLDGVGGVRVVGELTPSVLEGAAWGGDADALVINLDDDAAALLQVVEEALPDTPVVLLAPEPADYREAILDGPGVPGGRGYLLRQAGGEEIAAAVQAVVRGLVVMDPLVVAATRPERAGPVRAAVDKLVEPLTDRELEVLNLLALGLPNKGIALRLGISEHTVKFHVGAILSKLGAAGRTEAVMLAARRGLLPL